MPKTFFNNYKPQIMKKHPAKKGDDQKMRIKLDPKTSMFFGQLVHHGLAKFKVDPDMDEDEVHAAFQKGKGKTKGGKLIVHAKAAFVFIADDEDE